MTRPLVVSIITPSYNQAAFIEQTILSVCQQDYPHIEHIIVDGGSSDETVRVLQKYDSLKHLVWVSEPDTGQAHAINKGFQRATGDIICWLNTDDYYTPSAISTIVRYFNTHPEAVFVHGDAWAVDKTGRKYGLRAHVRACDYESLVCEGDFIVQPAAFWRSHLMEEVGLLDETLDYSLDYEYFIRIAQRWRLHYLPIPLAHERLHPSAKTFTGGVERMEEMRSIINQHGNIQLPHWFRAEAAAYYLQDGLTLIARGKLRQGLQQLRQAIQTNNSILRFMAYCFVLLFWGMRGIPRFRLVSNWIRYRMATLGRQRSTTVPIPLRYPRTLDRLS
jgi:glycosyltransferase involved in cell wall biosynthesis